VTYDPNPAQRDIIRAADPVLLVLGGAGTGKTTTAAAAAQHHLAKRDQARKAGESVARVLFLSFSRATAAQVVDRTGEILATQRDRVEVTTFHALAWRISSSTAARWDSMRCGCAPMPSAGCRRTGAAWPTQI